MSSPLVAKPLSALAQIGKVFALGLDVGRNTFKRPFQLRELIEQLWFIASVSILPAALVSIAFGSVISLQVGLLVTQIGAQALTGAASVLANVQQASPIITALLISGAGGTAVCAELGARTIREEIAALEVLGISPIQRLVVPRVLASAVVAVLLNGLITIVGLAGGYLYNVILQHGTPGAYIAGFSLLAQPADLVIGMIKAVFFGITAGVVASYRGLNPSGGPKGVGDAVNESVVISFILVFLINVVLTMVYLTIVPPKGM
jgi:phospholipid/cholesterol/gamma-HCH transport system permease protein